MLARRVNQRIIIDNGAIVITVTQISGDTVRIGIEADRSIPVHREETQWKVDADAETDGGGAC